MVLFDEVLIEKNQQTIALKKLNLNDLRRVMVTGGYNVVILTEDRIVYFNKDNEGEYGAYDLNVLEKKEETFERVVLLSYELSKIKESIDRKKLLNENLFLDTNSSNQNQTECKYVSINEPLDQLHDQIINTTSTHTIHSIINLKDNENCKFSFECLQNSLLCTDVASDLLKDDNEITQSTCSIEDDRGVTVDVSEENRLTHFLQSILDCQRDILKELKSINVRLTSLEDNVSFLYERQSMSTIIKLLNEIYLIDIRELDTRIISSNESKQMNSFFSYVAKFMNEDYCTRWSRIQNWLCLSTQPKSIEFNLLGFGKFNKLNKKFKKNAIQVIRSPVKSLNIIQFGNRASYVTSENILGDDDKTLIVLFEATTAKMYFTIDMLSNMENLNEKQQISMKKLIKKLCQLERQVYYLSFYYSIGLYQFFAGLALFELYRNPSVNPDELTNRIMGSEVIQNYVPLLFRLYKIHQFIITY